eukprot:TRINITY_DN3700_c0_g1_i5.p1 TRINITY_DN3700_c0_g1~~TRINITY_DN3700_c0_g1_i5.p1  ORF type:complete len:413 (-),score=62.61 TRINITY_DN3700_c0_g1_i5:63-1301(-)
MSVTKSGFLVEVSVVFLIWAAILVLFRILVVEQQNAAFLTVSDRNQNLLVGQLISMDEIKKVLQARKSPEQQFLDKDIMEVTKLKLSDVLEEQQPASNPLQRLAVKFSPEKQPELAKSISEDLRNTVQKQRDNMFSNYLESSLDCSIRFYYAWLSGGGDSFQLVYERSLESVFLFHPKACVFIYSDSLTEERFSRFKEAGYVVKISPLQSTMTHLVQGTPIEVWWHGREFYKREPYWINNFTNALRLLVLYEFGGVWLDTDIILFKSFLPLKNAVGIESGDLQTPYSIFLNGAVMVFDKHSPVLWRIMEDFVTDFNGLSWGYNCPRLITKTTLKLPQNKRGPDSVEILPRSAFYPIHFHDMRKFYDFSMLNQEQHDQQWQKLKEESYCLHWWHHFVAKKYSLKWDPSVSGAQ